MGRSHTSAQGRVQTRASRLRAACRRVRLGSGPRADASRLGPFRAVCRLCTRSGASAAQRPRPARTLPPPRPPGGPESSPAHPPGERVRSRASACASVLPPKGEDFLCSCTQLGLILLVGAMSGRRTLVGDHLRSVHNTFTSLSIFIPSSRPSWAFILFCNSFFLPPGL